MEITILVVPKLFTFCSKDRLKLHANQMMLVGWFRSPSSLTLDSYVRSCISFKRKLFLPGAFFSKAGSMMSETTISN